MIGALGRLITPFLKLREPMGLADSLWRMWIAAEESVQVELPLYASALEMLAAAWFRTGQGAFADSWLPVARFDELTQAEFDAVTAKLKGIPRADHVIGAIRRVNKMGANLRVPAFIDQLKLPVGKAERDALKARNTAIHGKILRTTAEIREAVQQGHALRTLYHRVMLALLGYEGVYIDRCTLGYPWRALREPAGGGPVVPFLAP